MPRRPARSVWSRTRATRRRFALVLLGLVAALLGLGALLRRRGGGAHPRREDDGPSERAVRLARLSGRDGDVPAVVPPSGACLENLRGAGPIECPYGLPAAPVAGRDYGAPFERGRSRCESAGLLRLPSRRLVATDPLVNLELDPLLLEAPEDRGEVILARTGERDDRNDVAFAMVRFRPARPARWELARMPRGGVAYFVDSGTGGFVDDVVVESLVRRRDNLLDAIRAQQDGAARPWANLCADPATGANLVAFSSGAGDGTYASYAGYDAAGALVAVVTDFELAEFTPEGGVRAHGGESETEGAGP